MTAEMKVIAHIENNFTEKFGIPRQSGLADIPSRIVFEPEYRIAEAFRGVEDYSHLWIIWQFSKAVRDSWSPTVRPPRLGGNKRMGVFATRSPFRPNNIGLSSVRLLRVLHTERGVELEVAGADMLNGTPIFDIKPYLAYTDSHPDASSGFALTAAEVMAVEIPGDILAKIPEDVREQVRSLLAQDPRPSYQDDPDREYTMSFGAMDISFKAVGGKVTVTGVKKL